MNIVITGHMGFLGRLVADRIEKDYPYANIRLIDLVDGNDIRSAVVFGKDCILVHLAAYISVTESSREFFKYYDNNFLAYSSFLENNSFSRIIYASSAAIYDDNGSIGPKSCYGFTKFLGEYLSKNHTSNTLSLRFSNPVGIDRQLHSKRNFCSMAFGEPSLMVKLAIAKQTESVFCIHDSQELTRDFFPSTLIAEVISKNVSTSLTGEYDLGSGVECNVRSLILNICSKYEIKYDLVPVPEGVVLKSVAKKHIPDFKGIKNYDPVKFVEESFVEYLNVDWASLVL